MRNSGIHEDSVFCAAVFDQYCFLGWSVILTQTMTEKDLKNKIVIMSIKKLS